MRGSRPTPADISSRSFYSGLHCGVPPTEPQTSALSSLSNFPHLRILRSHMSCLLSPPLQVQPHLRSVPSATSPKCASCIVTLRYIRSYDVFALKKAKICECPGFPIHRKQWVGGWHGTGSISWPGTAALGCPRSICPAYDAVLRPLASGSTSRLKLLSQSHRVFSIAKPIIYLTDTILDFDMHLTLLIIHFLKLCLCPGPVWYKLCTFSLNLYGHFFCLFTPHSLNAGAPQALCSSHCTCFL